MKIQNLFQKLKETSYYKTFKEKHKDAHFSVAFLILNLEDKTEQVQLDFFMPKENKIAAFAHPWREPKIHDNIISVQKGQTTPANPKPMSKQTTKIKIDIDDLEPKCKELIKENSSTIKPTKIIAILKDDIWNLTAMDNALGIIRIKINAVSEEVQDFNKGSLMDFMGMRKK